MDSQNNKKIKTIIDELGLENLSEEKKQELIMKMSEIAYKRIILRAIKNLSDEEAKELNDILKNQGEKQANDYLEEKNPDLFSTIIKEEVEKYRKEMIESVGE